MVAPDTGLRFERLRYASLLVLLGACFLFGGASRNDVSSLIVLQPLAVICGAAFLVTSPSLRWEAIGTSMVFLVALTGIIAVQLVPLPPALWTQLPGHGAMVASAELAGMAQPWRPISLTPDLTLSSLIGMVLPFAVLLGYGSLPTERGRSLLTPIAIGCAVSAFLGLAQLGGGASSPLYFYRVTSEGLPVGLLANRNHQAVLLAMALPMLASWANQPTDRRVFVSRRWIAAALSLFMILMIIATGSRAGLACGLVGAGAAVIFWQRRDAATPARGRLSKALFYGGIAAGILVVASAAYLSRDEGFQRAAGLSVEEDLRVRYLPTLIEVAADFFPVGSGFGSFDPVLRMYEPFEFLQPKYLNHAHNDLIELVIVGGLPALLVLIAFVSWIGLSVPSIIRFFSSSQSAAFGGLGLIIVLLALGSSLVDYPLRTPLHTALLAIALGWISDARASSVRRGAASAKRKGFTGNVPVHRAPD